jgi:hypothetical protein
MDPAFLSATAALAGSLIGGISSLAASFLTQREQLRAQVLLQQAVKREALYTEFIVEASRRLVEAWSHQAEGPEVVVNLYSLVERMRLTSSDEIISTALFVVRRLVEAYAAPEKTFDELQELMRSEDFTDPLREFSEACRRDLRSLRR